MANRVLWKLFFHRRTIRLESSLVKMRSILFNKKLFMLWEFEQNIIPVSGKRSLPHLPMWIYEVQNYDKIKSKYVTKKLAVRENSFLFLVFNCYFNDFFYGCSSRARPKRSARDKIGYWFFYFNFFFYHYFHSLFFITKHTNFLTHARFR